MEINMSPNLGAIKDNFNIKRNYRSQLIYDTLNIIGMTGTKELERRENSFIASDERDVVISLAECSIKDCNCSHESCKVCMPCTKEYHELIHQFYREHVRRGRMKRIFPIKKHHNDNLINHVCAANKFSIKWFYNKCKIDDEWC